MGTSNLDDHPQIVSLPHSEVDNQKLPNIHDQHHQCNSSSSSSSSSSQTPEHSTISDSQEDQNVNLVSSSSKLQIPSSAGEFKASNGKDSCKTPRSKEHRIPVTATCPPAPRKARSVPVNRKRKTPFFPVVEGPADFIIYMDARLALNEAIYVPDIVVGDLGNGADHVKKLKLVAPPAAHDT